MLASEELIFFSTHTHQVVLDSCLHLLHKTAELIHLTVC